MNQGISELIVIELMKELPISLKDNIFEFEELVNSGNYRAAYSVLDELKQSKEWSPSSKLIGYYERFWWELAN